MTHKKQQTMSAASSDAELWGTLDHLCNKARYWLYERKQRPRASRYADRLECALHKLPENNMAIIREEGLALLFELRGRIDEAIVHRQREIRLMEQLHDEARSLDYVASTRKYMLRGRDQAALRNRRGILASLQQARASDNHNLNRQAQ